MKENGKFINYSELIINDYDKVTTESEIEKIIQKENSLVASNERESTLFYALTSFVPTRRTFFSEAMNSM